MDANENPPPNAAPDSLAKRWFLFTLFGVIAYASVVFWLMSSAD